jgi:hypothetical protein
VRRLVALVVVLLVVWSGTAHAQPEASDRRVLVVSLPGVIWSDLAGGELPNLEALLGESAVAALAPRSVRAESRPGDAYLTISAGTRAIGSPALDGQQLPVDAEFAGEPAGGVFARRSGDEPGDAVVSLSWPALVRENDDEPYDAVLGLLAETLHGDDVTTAVIGNADGSDVTTVSYERQAGLALADEAGRIDGALGDELLLEDPIQPFGVRLDHERVLASFDEAWRDDERSVVLVEASDLARMLRYRSLVDAARAREVRRDALERADQLVGALLQRVDPERDAVLLVAPYSAPGASTLTLAGLRAQEVPAGYLVSASTQRPGIVTLVDVAPTILDLLDIARPVDMEGRPFDVERSSASLSHRIDHLSTITDVSAFRDRLLTPTTTALVLGLAAVVAAGVLAFVGDRSARWRRIVAFAALVDLAALPVSYLARAFPLEDLGSGFYWAFLVLGAVLVALAATALGRSQPERSLGAVLALAVAVLVGDVMTGDDLHFGSAFGYSPPGNSRLYGISNYSFGQLSVAACFVAALVAHRRSRRGAAVGLMVATLVVLGLPLWGSDVGGVIAFTPTLLVFAALIYERRPSIRAVIAVGLATIAAVAVFGLIDLSRPADERAHLGRLFERVGDEGIGPLVSIVERKLTANLEVSTSSFWVAAIPIALATWAFLRWWSTRPLAGLHARMPTLHAGLVAAVVAGVLGSLANDSGAISGGISALMIAASLIHLALSSAPVPPTSSSAG